MLYLLIDPIIFLIHDRDLEKREIIEQFLLFLEGWRRASAEYDIAFGISQDTIRALVATHTSIFNADFADRLAARLPLVAKEEVVKVISPLVERLLSERYFEALIERINNDKLDYHITAADLAPREYLDRLSYPGVEEAFRDALGLVAFARYQNIVPLSELDNIRLLTTYSDTERQLWAELTEYKIMLYVHFNWVLDSSIPDYEKRQRERELLYEFQAVTSIHHLSDVAERKRFNSVEAALKAANQHYPRRLIATEEARNTAVHASHPRPDKVYEALCGLVEVWLEAYERKGAFEANRAYYEKHKYRISRESEQVRMNPRMRQEREAAYKGKVIYAEYHVKMGVGPKAVRIHFAVEWDEGISKIILTRAGHHAATARFRH